MKSFGIRFLAGVAAGVFLAGPAWAGEEVLYQPAPAWVEPANPPKAEREPGKPLRHVSTQVRFADGVMWQYSGAVFALNTPEFLTALGTVSAQWFPDKGDLIVHRLELKRGNETIDLLAKGVKFEVLRREAQLERRMVDGMRTATVALREARVGDEIHLAYSITAKDQALGGAYEWGGPLLHDGLPLVDGSVKVSWPKGENLRHRLVGHAGKPNLTQTASGQQLVIDLPVAKPADMPTDAPSRFRQPPMLQLSSFDSWSAVSARLAPHYRAAGVIAAKGPLAERIAAIRAANTTDLTRAAAALRAVQDDVSYLYEGMNGGNYLPQKPEETWDKRSGDCKAKSLLLHAMLRELGITSDVVLVSTEGGDAIPDYLPAPGAFDHMIVHARIGGQDYWLDGTTAGTRLPNIGDVPPFRWALPLKPEGSDLVAMTARSPAQPLEHLTVTLDQTAGIKVPALFTAELRVTGPTAAFARMLADAEEGEEKEQALTGILGKYLGDAQYTSTAIAFHDEEGVGVVRATGIMTSPWKADNGNLRLEVPYQPAASFGFNNDRSKPEWQGLPVTINSPYRENVSVTVRLPDGGNGFRVMGQPSFAETIGRNSLRWDGAIKDGVFLLKQDVAHLDFELPANELPETKRQTARMLRALPKLAAPADTRREWQYHGADRKLLQPLVDAYARLVADAEAEDVLPLSNRAAFRRGTGDWKGALDDLSAVIAKDPSADHYMARAGVREQLGDLTGTLADLREAEKLEGDGSTHHWQVGLLGKLGRGKEAATVAADYAAFAEDPDRAEVLLAIAKGWAGAHAEGAAMLDALVQSSPSDSYLLNETCWFAAIWNVAVADALDTCNRAVQLNGGPGALDSRAVALFRVGEHDKALADLNTALAASPGLHETRYMRGVVRLHSGDAGGAADVREALAAKPSLAKQYGTWGLVPPKK